MQPLAYHHSSHTSMGHTGAIIFGIVILIVGIAQFLMPERTFWTMIGRRHRSSVTASASWSERGNKIAGVLLALAGILVIVLNLVQPPS